MNKNKLFKIKNFFRILYFLKLLKNTFKKILNKKKNIILKVV